MTSDFRRVKTGRLSVARVLVDARAQRLEQRQPLGGIVGAIGNGRRPFEELLGRGRGEELNRLRRLRRGHERQVEAIFAAGDAKFRNRLIHQLHDLRDVAGPIAIMLARPRIEPPTRLDRELQLAARVVRQCNLVQDAGDVAGKIGKVRLAPRVGVTGGAQRFRVLLCPRPVDSGGGQRGQLRRPFSAQGQREDDPLADSGVLAETRHDRAVAQKQAEKRRNFGLRRKGRQRGRRRRSDAARPQPLRRRVGPRPPIVCTKLSVVCGLKTVKRPSANKSPCGNHVDERWIHCGRRLEKNISAHERGAISPARRCGRHLRASFRLITCAQSLQ